MNYLRRICRIVNRAVLLLACWVALFEVAMAEKKAPPAPPPSEGSSFDYTLQYFIVILGIALGLLLVLRSSNRQERDHPEQYVGKNLLGD